MHVDARARIPLVDLRPSYRGLKEDLLTRIGALVDEGRFVGGAPVRDFEEAFAAYTGAAHCVGTSSGLDALRLGLLAAGLEPGDGVVAPANTFVATIEAIAQAGGRPVLVDASPADYNLDVDAAAEAVGPRTRFLLPVHLYGQMADMASLRRTAARAGLGIVEDACQAHGAERDGVRPGEAALAAAYSFYPAKNLGAMGDAGALTTGDEGLAARVQALREHGQTARYEHAVEGWTARLDAVQAVVLAARLRLLPAWNEERRRAAASYLEALEGVGDLTLPPVAPGATHVWHLFVIRTARPEALAERLAAEGIETGRHYPQPVHLTGAYARLGYREGEFPVAERLAREVVSLPLFPGITEAQLETVVTAIRRYFAGGRSVTL